jgi:glycosyltransferase involved in cell wall biosynthesis
VDRFHLNRILQVVEPGEYGVFEHVSSLIDYVQKHHPEIGVDLAYSSCRSRRAAGSGTTLAELVQRVHDRGGEAIDLRVKSAPQWADLPALLHVARLAKRTGAQIVHGHSSKAGGLVRLARWVAPGFPPTVYTPNAYYGMDGDASLKAGLYKGIERLLGRTGITINCSSDEREFALHELGIPSRHSVLVNNSIETAVFAPITREEKKRLRIKLGVPEDAVVFISVGGDRPQKNYGPLYRMLESLLTDSRYRDRCFFVHAGFNSTKLAATLSPAARERTHTFEYLDPAREAVLAADAFILTSRYEGLSFSVLGALASGIKTFLTRVPGNNGFAQLGFDEISWIDPTSDDAFLAARVGDAVRSWLDPQQASGVPPTPSAKQAALAQTHFDNATQYEKLLQTYLRTLEQGLDHRLGGLDPA